MEQENLNLVVKILRTIVRKYPTSLECFLALCKLGGIILDVEGEVRLSGSDLSAAKSDYLGVLNGNYPTQTQLYVLSTIEYFMYICDGEMTGWPELLPFFFGLFDTNLLASLTFCCTFIQIRPSDDLMLMVRSHLDFESPEADIRAMSLRFAITSLFSSPREDPLIENIPEILASLSAPHLSTTFTYVWKLFKAHPELFDAVLAELISLLLSVAGDKSQPELQRRDALFFFSRFLHFSEACSSLCFGIKENVLRCASACLQHPVLQPDLYAESTALLHAFIRLPEMEELVLRYCQDSNPDIASAFLMFSKQFPQAVIGFVKSDDPVLRANGLAAIKDYPPTVEIGESLFAGMESDAWTDFVDGFTTWAYFCPIDLLAPFRPRLFLEHRLDSRLMLCEAVFSLRTEAVDEAIALLDQVYHIFAQSRGGDRHLEIIAKLLSIVPAEFLSEYLVKVVPFVIRNPTCLISIDFLLLVSALSRLFLPFLDETVAALVAQVEQNGPVIPSLEMLQNLVEMFGGHCNSNVLSAPALGGIPEQTDNAARLELLKLLNAILPPDRRPSFGLLRCPYLAFYLILNDGTVSRHKQIHSLIRIYDCFINRG
jgi:hypothetical protein